MRLPEPEEDDFVNVAVTIPEGVRAGSKLFVNVEGCHKGQIEVTVPEGMMPGQTFSVKVLAAYRPRARLLVSITQARGLARHSAAAGLLPFSNVRIEWAASSGTGKLIASGKTRTVAERTPDPVFDHALSGGASDSDASTSSMFMVSVGVTAKGAPKPMILRCKIFAGEKKIGTVKVPVRSRSGEVNVPIDLWYNVTMAKVQKSAAPTGRPSPGGRKGRRLPSSLPSRPPTAALTAAQAPPPQIRVSYLFYDAPALKDFVADSVKAQQQLLELRQEAYRRKLANSEKEGAVPPAHIMDAEKQAIVDQIGRTESEAETLRREIAQVHAEVHAAEAHYANLFAGVSDTAASAVDAYSDAAYAEDSGSAWGGAEPAAGAGGAAGTPWRALHSASDGTHYYHNVEDGSTAWDLPEGFLGTPAASWVTHTDADSGSEYFVNIETGATTWDRPAALA